MILDSLLFFTGGVGGVGNSDGLTDSPTTGSAQVSSNILDLAGPALPASSTTPFAVPGRDLGIGDDPALKLLVIVNTAFVNGTDMTIAFQGAPDNGSGGATTWTTYASGPKVAEASMVAGCRLLDIDWPRPAPTVVPPRFVRLNYVITGTHNAGKLLGTVVLDRHDQPTDSTAVLGAYPPGITISN